MMKQLLLTATIAVTITTAQANIPELYDFVRLEPVKVKSVLCTQQPNDPAVSECEAYYYNNTSRIWWLKEVNGVVYRYDRYPVDDEVKPVPFK